MSVQTENQPNPATPEPSLKPPETTGQNSRRWWKIAAGGFVFRRRRPLAWQTAGALLLAAIGILLWRTGRQAKLQAAPATEQAQTVAVARVGREDLFNEVTIPAEFRPYLQVELHAKVSGYVDQIYVDIGDRVKAGQLLAKLEVPELRAELARAKAAEKRAEADYRDAHAVYTRLLSVQKENTNWVAQQELDAAEAKDAATDAALASAKAECEKDQMLLDYTQITAPFDGVITCRYADPGSLIQAGTSSDTQAKPLVRLSDNYHLRLDFPVSVAYVSKIREGEPVEIRMDSAEPVLTGTIARTTRKVETATRKMEVEVDVPNPELKLIPGMYAWITLRFDRREKTLSIPIGAVSREKGGTVLMVNNENKIEERVVKLGLETPQKIEVLAGLSENDLVLLGSRGRLRPGELVQPKLVQEAKIAE